MFQMHVWFYLACLVASSGYALACGGAPERGAAWINLIGTIASFLLSVLLPAHRWAGMMPATSLIDLLVCIAFLVLMLTSNRLWPIPCFGLTTVTVLSHAARMLQLHLSARIYYQTESGWAYPILLLVAIGTWRHPRRGTPSTARS